MKKLNKFIAFVATAILCFAMFSFVGCNKKATAYTICVQDASGNAVKNVQVGLCSYNEETKEKGSCLEPVETDDDGKAVVEVEEGTYILNNDTLGSYKYKEDYVVKAYGEYTVVVVAK